MAAGVVQLSHPLNAACPDCRCPKWLHTAARCLTLRLMGGTPRAPKLQRCGCSKRIQDFAA